jgi:hypothetical protein
MKKGLFIFLIFCFSLTIISCSDEEEESTTDTVITTTDTVITTTDTVITTTDTVITTSQMGGSIQGMELSLSTAVTTVAGTGSSGSANGTGTSASFTEPYGITTNERKLLKEIEKLLNQSSQLKEVRLVQIIKS